MIDKSKFLERSDDTGRHIITSLKTGKTYFIEPIGNPKTNFGDVNPATGKIEGQYGNKYKGSINESESMITKENGFENIHYTGIGTSPYSFIEQLEKDGK